MDVFLFESCLKVIIKYLLRSALSLNFLPSRTKDLTEFDRLLLPPSAKTQFAGIITRDGENTTCDTT